ncbi:MAG: T9SS type A sorting domain-containing protein [Flavobacteriales bacterium]|nr:T9SS type A sorting domain-containing protein [Flavobacteriales bacterium]
MHRQRTDVLDYVVIPALVEITTLTAGADGRIMLPASLSASAQLELFDAQGRPVKEFRSFHQHNGIDLGQRNAGIYVLRLFDGRTSRTFRVGARGWQAMMCERCFGNTMVDRSLRYSRITTTGRSMVSGRRKTTAKCFRERTHRRRHCAGIKSKLRLT